MSHPQLDALLRTLAANDGSDLHVKGDAPPRIRVDGDLRRLEHEPLAPGTVADMARAIMRADVAEGFERRNEADFAYMIEGVGRFRVNAFRQRGSVAMIFRRVRANADTIEALGLPVVLARLASEPRGLVLVTGPTGSGKTTTLAAMRTPSRSSTTTSGRPSNSVRSVWTRPTSPWPCGPPCARIPT